MISPRILLVASVAAAFACGDDKPKNKPQPPAPSAPVAVTNGDQTIAELATVNLNGSASYDADGDLATFQWTQTLGPTVSLTGANTAAATFPAPNVGDTTTFRFLLTVTDAGGRSDTATATITVIDLNAAPQVNAGLEQTVDALQVVTLTGTATDPDSLGSIASVAWTQVGNPSAGTITNADALVATFTAPDVDQNVALVFTLTAIDNEGKSASSTVQVNVRPVAAQLTFAAVPSSANRHAAFGLVQLQVRNAAGLRIIGGAAARVNVTLSAELESGGAAPGTLGGVLSKFTAEGVATFDDLSYDLLTATGARLVLRAVSTAPAGLTDAVSTPISIVWPSNFPGLLQADGLIEIHDMEYLNDAAGAGLLVVGAFDGTDVDFDLAGGGANLLTSDGTDGFVARYAVSNGSLVWVRVIGGAADERVTSVSVGAGRDILITVAYGLATVEFPTATTPLTQASVGGRDAAFAELDTDGYALWTGAIAGAGDDDATAAAADNVGRVTVVGAFNGIAVDFDPGAGTAESSSQGASVADAFILKLDPAGVYQWHYVYGGAGADRAVAVGHTTSAGDPLVVGQRGNDAFFLRMRRAPTVPTTPEIIHERLFGGAGSNSFQVNAGYCDASDRMTLAGLFTGTVDLDPETGSVPVTEQNSGDSGFVVTINSAGSYAGHALFAADTLAVTGVMVRTSGTRSTLVSGTFRSDGNFDLDSPSPEVVGPNNADQGYLLSIVSNRFDWVDVVDGPAGLDSPVTAMTSNGPQLFAAAELGVGTSDVDLGPTFVSGTVAGGNDGGLLVKLSESGLTIP